MNRKILNGLVGVAMLGAAASANAFLVPFQGHVVNAQFDVTNLNGAAGFNMALTLGGPIPVVNPLGDSVTFSGFGGLAGKTVGDSVSANKIFAAGLFAYDFDGTPGFGAGDIFGLLNQLVFSGDATTTVTAGTIPASITTASANSAGSFSTVYTGAFSALPGATGAAINLLTGNGGPVSGKLDVSWIFDTTTEKLDITLLDSSLSGWLGFEGVFNALDAAGNADSKIDGKLYMANGVNANGSIGSGNFVVSAVPEPASLALLGIGVAGLGFMRRRKA